MHERPRLPRLFFCLILCLPGTLWAQQADDPVIWKNVTLTMEDGTHRGPGDLEWILEGFSLRLTIPDSTEATFAPSKIAAITDDTGRNITQEVADASPADVHFALLGENRPDPLILGLSADAGGSIGMTKGYGAFKGTGAWFAGLRWGFHEWAHLRAQYRSQYIKESSPGSGSAIATWADEFSLLVGFRPTHPRRNDNYSYIEVGVVFVSWKERFDEDLQAMQSSSDTGTGFITRGGVIIPVAARFGIDLGAMVSVRPRLDPMDDGTAWSVGLNVAVATIR